jgi:HlyD family secretion protein
MKWGTIITVAIVIVGSGIWYFHRGHNDAPAYQTVAVTRGELVKLVTATGTLNPVTNVTVGCQVSGRISKLYVDFNSPVTNSQLIAEIDPRTYQATVEQAAADLANAKANLELQQAQAKRSSDLFKNNLISGSDYDTAVANLHEAEAMVKIKKASLDNATANLGYCKIFSPVDGIVISRAVDVGQTVAASLQSPTLFQIANDLTKMQIDSSVAEADVGGVAEGQEVAFTVDAYPDRTFHGEVTQVRNSPTTVNNVVTYDCVIGVTNADYKLKPGMTANVSVVVAQRENALTIPNGALRFRPPDNAVMLTNSVATRMMPTTNGGNFAREPGAPGGRRGGERGGWRGHGDHPVFLFHTVYVLAGEGNDAKLKAVQIKTGISDGISTEVLSGLDEGAPVVTGMALTGTKAAATANPFGGGGGFPRMR